MGPGMDPAFVLILFGDARFSSSSRGFGSAPVRWFRHMLPAYGHTLETCEFRTSITCSACLRPTKHARLPVSGPELDELPVGQRRVLNKNVQVQARPHQHPMSCRTALLHAAHGPPCMHACMVPFQGRSEPGLNCPQAFTVQRILPDHSRPVAPSRPDGNWKCACLQVCTHCHINWNRDFNAARNILTVGLSQLDPTGHPKPARFQR